MIGILLVIGIVIGLVVRTAVSWRKYSAQGLIHGTTPGQRIASYLAAASADINSRKGRR